MKNRIATLALMAMIAVGPAFLGCATLAEIGSSAAVGASAATPGQANTLADALQGAKLATDAIDLYVTSANLNRDTLTHLSALNDAVHAALGGLEAANARGESLKFAAFNEALRAFNAYAASKGVNH